MKIRYQSLLRSGELNEMTKCGERERRGETLLYRLNLQEVYFSWIIIELFYQGYESNHSSGSKGMGHVFAALQPLPPESCWGIRYITFYISTLGTILLVYYFSL